MSSQGATVLGKRRHTHTVQTGSEGPDPGEVHSQYQSAIGQDPEVRWQPPLPLEIPNSGIIPIQVSQHLFLCREKHIQTIETEDIVVILALHHKPNPAPSKPASIC